MKMEDPKTRILKAAIEEFSEKGYSSASTNSIHKKAGVSKGAVFANYNSKAELFYRAFEHCTDLTISEYRKHDFGKIHDLFERLIAITLWKLDFFSKNPGIYRVIQLAISESPPEIKEQVNDDLKKFLEISGDLFFSELDASRFSEEYTEEEARFFFKIALAGLQSHYFRQGVTLEDFQENKEMGLKFLKTVLKGMEK